MTKAETQTKLQDIFGYLLRHCTDEEVELIEWAAGHVANEFKVTLEVRGYTIQAV